MKAYELLFFVDPSLDPETRLAVMKRIDTTIAEGAGNGDGLRQQVDAQSAVIGKTRALCVAVRTGTFKGASVKRLC